MKGDSPASADARQVYPPRGYAWYVVAVLLIIGITSYLDRNIISLLVEPIKADLNLTDTEVSVLQGTAYAIFYVAFGLPFGGGRHVVAHHQCLQAFRRQSAVARVQPGQQIGQRRAQRRRGRFQPRTENMNGGHYASH